MSTTKNDCYTPSTKYCACVEFQPDEVHRCGFHTSQLLHYRLEPNPDAGVKEVPPQKLTLAFSTADVVILGGELERLATYLRENALAIVRVSPKPTGEAMPCAPYVTAINIMPVEKS